MTLSSERALLHQLLDPLPDDHATEELPAVVSDEESLTRRRLRELSEAAAHVLGARGLSRGARVLMTHTTTCSLPLVVFGAARSGVVFTIVHDQVPVATFRHILSDCDPTLVVSDDRSIRDIAADAGRQAVDWLTLRSEITQSASSSPPPGAAEPPLPIDPACLIYTSGTTALPKAVVSTHTQMVFAAAAIAERLDYRRRDVVWCPLPLSFDYGLYQVFLSALVGATLRLAPASSVGPRMLTMLDEAHATVLPSMPPITTTLLSLLRREPDRSPPPIRLLTNTGAHLPSEVLAGLRRRMPRLQVQLMFGLTECKRISIMAPDEDLDRPGALGRALPGTEVFAVDNNGDPLPRGALGELTVRGPHVMSGYWRRAELTAKRFVRRDDLFPELRTGDYGWVDADGYIYFRGRRDDVYKQQGFRVSAVEVESAAHQVDGVDTAAVLVPDDERPNALLVVTGRVEPRSVLLALREHVEDHKVPPHCVVVADLPTNANGKTDKAVLAVRLGARLVH